MKHREIINILILVGSAFLLVAVLSYFNLYEGLEDEGMEDEKKRMDIPPPPPPDASPAAATGPVTVTKFSTF